MIDSDRNYFSRQINITKKEIQAMEKHKWRNWNNLKKARIKLRALEEGQRDILNTNITNANVLTDTVDKNNYQTYTKKVDGAYKMYNATTDYGAEICKGIVESRVAFIAGEGLSVNSTNKKKLDFIDRFLTKNKLHGTRLMDVITIGELEGKNLIILGTKDKNDEKIITARTFSWYWNNYTVEVDPMDRDEVKSIKYKEKKKDMKEKTINIKRSTFVKIGGIEKDINHTNSKLHSVLTEIENFSRAKYDLRKNTHVFGRYIPYWKTLTTQEAKSIKNDLQENSWEVGTGYAGMADFSIVEPSGAAAEAILKDMLTGLKCISITMGIPIHFLAYPELMSNRATAESLHEVVIAGTRKERLIWEEAFHDLIEKACIMAVDEAVEDNAILKGDFQVKLPVISISLLKQIIEIWYPLLSDNIISMFTFLNMLPGIDPEKEAKLVDKEIEKKMERNPFANKLIPEEQKPEDEKMPEEENGKIEKNVPNK